jgi:transcriptional regulator GlxA family with amidase domain
MMIIEQKLGETRPLWRLLEPLGISMRQIERRFVSDVGLTPRMYRLRLRLARAKWLVEHTDRSVTEIGLDCGFNDCSHFSRTFKHHFKTKPALARRLARTAVGA